MSLYIEQAKKVLKSEADGVRELIKKLDNNFDKAIKLMYNCKGRIVITGMGKPGIISQKISATMASTGTPSLSLHPADAVHGDMGRVTKKDVVIAISNSGETEEILRLLPVLQKIGSKLIAITGNVNSTLAKNSDCCLDVSVKKEACTLGLAPTTSTTAMLAMGDALAVVLSKKKNFREPDFALYHPGGNLGKRLLLKVDDLMRKGKQNPVVKENTLLKHALLKITNARAGSCTVVNNKNKVSGIFTDGDLRRHIESGKDFHCLKIKDVMTKNPAVVKTGILASEAAGILKKYSIDEIPVVNSRGFPVGLLDIQDILRSGL